MKLSALIRYSTSMTEIPKKRLSSLLLFGAVGACIVLYVALATPLYDDGFNADLVLGIPFYSEYFKLYIPFFKPLTAIQLPVHYLPYPWSFAAATFIHVLLMAAASGLSFLIARRYVPSKVALVAGFLTLYALLTHETFMTTRPEALLYHFSLTMP